MKINVEDRIYGGSGSRKFSLQERFELLTDKSGECWIWTGSRAKGYGRLTAFGRVMKAHRLSWELHYGPIPDKMLVCHLCDNPPCVRPEHLWLGNDKENLADRDQKGRQARGSMIKNTAKLSESAVVEMRDLWKTKEVLTFEALSRRYGITKEQTRNIIARRSWKHVE